MLLGQNLRGGHQGRLAAVLHHKVHAGGGYHGLAGAHVPLAQAVHGDAPLHVGQGLVHAAALGVRQGEGEDTVKPVHIHGAAGLHLHHLSPPAQPLQANGEQKQLLKGQPAPGQVQRLGTLRKVDVLVGVADAAQVVLPPDLVRQGVRQNVGALVQPLADGPGQHQLAHPRRQGIDGHDAARHLPAALRLHHRGGHGPAQKVPLRLSVKIIGLPLAEVVFQPGLVEKRHVQHAGLVHGPDLDEVHTLSDVGDGGGRGDHGGHAGALAGNQVRDALDLGAVLVFPREPADEVPQGEDAQLPQGLGPLLADAADHPHIRVKLRHIPPPFRKRVQKYMIYYIIPPEKTQGIPPIAKTGNRRQKNVTFRALRS